MVTRLTTYLSFVRFSHSVFALPFAFAGALLAARQSPLTWAKVAWILVAMVAARSAAMGFNRLVDARFDALNPRTANREIPRGAMSTREAVAFVVVAVGGLRLRGLAVEPSLFRAVAGGARHRVLVLAGETLHGVDADVPWARDGGRAGRRVARGRRTRRSGSRGCSRSRSAPGSAASTSCMRARTSTSIARTACARSRCGSVCDRRSRYHARCTSSTIVCLLALGAVTPLPWFYYAGVGAVAALLAYEQSLVRPTDLSQVKRAFDLNGYVGILYLVVLALSLWRA